MDKIIVVSPFRNCENWIRPCIRSVKAQDYDNYEAYFVDDCSTDSTPEICREEAKDEPRVNIILGTERKYKFRNFRETVDSLELTGEEIIAILDGDDWFANRSVLSTVAKAYEEHDCLITYGSYVEYPSGERGKFSRKLDPKVIKERTYRKQPWSTSHLFTFKSKLWKHLNDEDFKDKKGQYLNYATDVALIMPLLEMAGDRIHFIEDKLYVYNTTNPLNEHKVDHRQQLDNEAYIRSLPKKELVKW